MILYVISAMSQATYALLHLGRWVVVYHKPWCCTLPSMVRVCDEQVHAIDSEG